MLLERSKDTIALYNVSTGVRFAKRKIKLDGLEELVLTKEPAKVLPLLERALTTAGQAGGHPRVRRHHRAGRRHLVLDGRRPRRGGDAAPLVAACARSSSRTRSCILTLENLSELHPKLVSNPRVATVRVPMPTKDERAALLALPRSGAVATTTSIAWPR